MGNCQTGNYRLSLDSLFRLRLVTIIVTIRKQKRTNQISCKLFLICLK